MARKPSTRTEIENALLTQLTMLGAMKEQYIDLIRDYMRLWDVKKALFSDVKKRGVTYQEHNAQGMAITKNNPSTKEVLATNKQMLSLLKELGLGTANASGDDDDEDSDGC